MAYHLPLGIMDKTEEFNFSLQVYIDKKPDFYNFKEETKCLTEKEILDMYSN